MTTKHARRRSWERTKAFVKRHPRGVGILIVACFLVVYGLHSNWLSRSVEVIVKPFRPLSEEEYARKHDPDYLPQDFWNHGALVHFTDLNPFPAIVPDFRPTKPSERAIVTALFTDSYTHAIAVLGHSVRKHHPDTRRIAVYIPNQISEQTLCLAKTQGWELMPIERVPPPRNGHRIHPKLVDQYTKLKLWTLDTIGIHSVIYIDGDTLLLNPIPDELFDTPFAFAAVPDGIESPLINGGMMVIKTNSAVYEDMLVKMETAEYNLGWAEQNFLNLYWGRQMLRLPFIYNANAWIKMSSPNMWRGMVESKEMVLMHFTCAKPVPAHEGGALTWIETSAAMRWKMESQEDWKEELLMWREEWEAMKDEQFDEVTSCVPFREEKGSRLRLKEAGVPKKYWP